MSNELNKNYCTKNKDKIYGIYEIDKEWHMNSKSKYCYESAWKYNKECRNDTDCFDPKLISYLNNNKGLIGALKAKLKKLG